MNSTHSDRRDIILSALDLGILILFALVALYMRSSVAQTDGLTLIVPPEHRSAQDGTPMVFLSWGNLVDEADPTEDRCIIVAHFGTMSAAGERLELPCQPTAFGRVPFVYNERLRAAAKTGTHAVILCPNSSTSVEACARMYFLMADHGFNTVTLSSR